MRTSTMAVLLALLPQGQDPKPPATPAPVAAKEPAAQAAADPKDVDSVASLMRAVYDVISGPAGQKRNWERMRGLFHPDARLVPMGKGKEGGVRAVPLTIADYIQRSGPFLEQNGFFEQEIAQHVDAYGDFAQVFSTYEGRKAKTDATPFLRGINSLQLVHQGGRWWVLQILWEQEADAGPIPAQYLPK